MTEPRGFQLHCTTSVKVMKGTMEIEERLVDSLARVGLVETNESSMAQFVPPGLGRPA